MKLLFVPLLRKSHSKDCMNLFEEVCNMHSIDLCVSISGKTYSPLKIWLKLKSQISGNRIPFSKAGNFIHFKTLQGESEQLTHNKLIGPKNRHRSKGSVSQLTDDLD